MRHTDQDAGRIPVVSVIVPTFNRMPLLEHTVASVLAQSFADLELVVVDDGSTDDTLEYVRHFDDPRVRSIACSHTGDVGAVRNAGAAAARGDWLCFLDSDDLWHPKKLEQQLSETESAGVRWSYTRYQLIDLDDNPIPWRAGRSTAKSGWIVRDLLTDELGIGLGTVMVQRSLFAELVGFQLHLRFREDYDLVVRLALSARAHAVDECLASVREHADRTTSNVPAERAYLDMATVFGALAPLLAEKSLRAIARRRQAESLAEAGARLMRTGNLREAVTCFSRAVAAGVPVTCLVSALARGAGVRSGIQV